MAVTYIGAWPGSRSATASVTSTTRAIRAGGSARLDHYFSRGGDIDALPGYAQAFSLLDAAMRELSGDAVRYPAARRPVVRGAVEVQL